MSGTNTKGAPYTPNQGPADPKQVSLYAFQELGKVAMALRNLNTRLSALEAKEGTT